ncbi:type 2 periplasmic-binding domain-containing protein [Paenibacillus cymbidii]|uniref:hypothetical protein n=1 Tax=Paenibacillus cymbidii TaxID=1639034 RepID=UPI0010818DD7|nr:hypothetical protein [Paenibacillus cymbidii]
MKLKKTMVVVAVLTLSISTVLSACSSKKETSKEQASSSPASTPAATQASTPTPKPVIRMTISLQQGSLYEGVQSDPVAKEIERRLGIQLDFKSMNEDQFKVLAASGDLPEIVLAQRKWLKVLVDGNKIIPLDDLVANAPNIKKQADRIKFSKQYLSENKGNLYALSAGGGPVAMQYMYDVGPNIRWDYYKELGYPAMNNPDDFLNVMKQMQDKHPKTADGKKVYAFSLWNDWGTWPYKLYQTYGSGVEQMGTMEYNSDFAAKNFLMDESSSWWAGIKFYNKANQMGLLDPESFVQKFDNMQAKGNNGQILSTYAAWTTQLNAELAKQGKDTAGFMPVPGMYPYVFHGGYSNNGNQDYLLVITKNNKNPQRAMELLDFAFSEEGSRILWSGIEGEHWMKEGGVSKLKPDIVANYDTANNAFVNLSGITKYQKMAGFNAAKVHADGQRMDLALAPEVFVKRSNPLDKDFSSHYNVVYPGQYYDKLVAEKKLKFLEINTDFQVATGTVPDDIKRIDDNLMTFISTNVPKVIMAKTDAEFTTQMKSVIAEMVKMGLDQSNAYWTDVFTRTKASFKP